MALSLLLDEDSQAKRLVNLLKNAGHSVETINSAGMVGAPDTEVLAYACKQNRILLTRNCSDFQAIHQSDPAHPGILAVYQNADVEKNMSYQNILEAIENIESAGVRIDNEFIVLNRWKY